MLVRHFQIAELGGPNAVAEMTGRKGRIVANGRGRCHRTGPLNLPICQPLKCTTAMTQASVAS